MQWDLGLEGLALLGAISLGFGVVAGLLVGDGRARRAWATALNAVACFGVGLLASEWLFGWATEDGLQPNIDGLSRDEVLLSSLLTTAVVVLVMRYLAHRTEGSDHVGWHLSDDTTDNSPVTRDAEARPSHGSAARRDEPRGAVSGGQMAEPRKQKRQHGYRDDAAWVGVCAGAGAAFGVAIGGGAGIALGLALGAGVGAALAAWRIHQGPGAGR